MPFNTLTTRMPQGVTNAEASETLGAAGFPDPTWAFVYSNDFDNFINTDFTQSGVGSANFTGTDYDGGAILSITSAGVADSAHLQRRNAHFKLGQGRDTFFKYAGQLSDVINCIFTAGLYSLSASAVAASDGVFFFKASGASSLVLRSVVGGVATDYPLPALETLTNAVRFELGFHIDPQNNVEVFYNPGTGLTVQNPAAGDSRGRVAAAYNANVTTALTAPGFGITNTTAVVRSLTSDFLVAARHR